MTSISILIAAYRPDFLEACLRSALQQTRPADEILVGDDSSDHRVEAIVRHLGRHDDRVVYHRNPAPTGFDVDNYVGLLSRASGDLVKPLNDDDWLEPDALRRMAAVLESRPDVSLVTSHRRVVDAKAAPVGDLASTRRPSPVDVVIRGDVVARHVVACRHNPVGEPTSAMFRRRELVSRPHRQQVGALELGALTDVAWWLTLLAQGDLAYLTTTLSAFRLHAGQIQQRPDRAAACEAAWDVLASGHVVAERAGPVTSPLVARPWWSPALREAGPATDLAGIGALLRAEGADDTAVLRLAQLLASRGQDRDVVDLLAPLVQDPASTPEASRWFAGFLAARGHADAAAQLQASVRTAVDDHLLSAAHQALLTPA